MMLEEAYAAVCSQVAAAEQRAGRESGSVRLLAVSKKKPAEDIACLYHLGQRDFAENYLQEAQEKQQKLNSLAIVWHFIGRIQSRKAAAIAKHFAWVHAVDSEVLLDKLERSRADSGLPPLNVCLQVNVSGDPAKGGLKEDAVASLCQKAAGCTNLRLRGLMTILKAQQQEDAILADYTKLSQLKGSLNQQGFLLDTLSMGMSQDFPLAIESGATWIRVGQALFGARK